MLIGLLGSLLFGTSVYADSYANVNVDALNVRQAPKLGATVTDTYYRNTMVKIVDRVSQDWFEVESDNGGAAYLNAAHVDVFKVKATINANGVNTRAYPAMDAKINGQLNKGEDMSVFYQVGDWYYVSLSTREAYSFVHKKYLDSDFLSLVPKKDISQVKELEVQTPTMTKADQVVAYAKQYIGNPYRYGGNSLTRGIDCSGFTQQIMKKVGVSLHRSSAAQYASNGVKVSTNNLQPGDLLFYGYGGRVSHVGIYIGDKKMVNASSSTTGIIISNAFRTRGKPLIGAKRVI